MIPREVTGVAGSGMMEGSGLPDGAAVPPPSSTKRRPRLTYVEHLYHQSPTERPFHTESTGSRWLDTDDQPYMRNLKVGSRWQPLTEGSWLSECSQLVLRNEMPVPQVIVSEGKTEGVGVILEVGVMVTIEQPGPRTMHSPDRIPPKVLTLWRVGPGESMRGEPVEPKSLLVRAVFPEGQSEQVARAKLVLIPR